MEDTAPDVPLHHVLERAVVVMFALADDRAILSAAAAIIGEVVGTVGCCNDR